MKKFNVRFKRNEEVQEVDRVVIMIDDQEYTITADKFEGIVVNKGLESICIYPNVGNQIRIV